MEYNIETLKKEINYQNNILFYPNFSEYKLEQLSTGLGEFITKYYTDKGKQLSDITIDVCGVVTNICVVNTCISGYKMFEYLNIKNKKGIPKFRLLNEYCLNLYAVPIAASSFINMASVEYEFYNYEDEYKSKEQSKPISIINVPSVDGYIIPQIVS